MSPAQFPVVLATPVTDERDHVSSLLVQWQDAPVAQAAEVLQALLVESGLANAFPKLGYTFLESAREQVMTANLPSGLQLHFVPSAVPQELTHPKSTASASTLLLKLLGQITSDAETRDIEDTLKHDPQLSVQLLRLVNSVSFSLREPVTSFGQAINILGRRQLQRWLQILMYAGQNAPGYGKVLMVRAALRGALMEQLAKAQPGAGVAPDTAFITGMFSLLDVLFDKPLGEVVLPLKMGDEINVALLKHEGTAGAMLELVVAAQNHALADVARLLGQLAITPRAWCTAQAAALQWAMQIGMET